MESIIIRDSTSDESSSSLSSSSSNIYKKNSFNNKNKNRIYNSIKQKASSYNKSSDIVKYVKIICTIGIVVLIIFQFYYNFFIYNNKISIHSITNLNVDNLFESQINEKTYMLYKMYANKTIYLPLNETELTPEQQEHQLTYLENNQVYEDEMYSFRNTINQVYINVELPHQYCLKVPNTLQGYLDSNILLAKANLSSLVQFYDDKNRNKTLEENKDYIKNSKNKKIAFRDLFYLNGTEYMKNDSNANYENWLLWNTNNMTGLLNMSKEFFGADGTRVELGGHWKPKECKSNFKIAIIIPYRDRLPHLKVLLYYLHLILQRQQLDYRIFVVEPTSPPEVRFNKGRVMNAAFLEALKIDPQIDCFVFHDVDLIPEDDRTMYSCPPKPRHLSAAIDKFDYVLPYNYLVGGVFVIRTESYRQINGYSNLYWGWGAEDDDLSVRIKSHNLDIIRPPTKLARYKMIRHKQQKLNPQAHDNLKKTKSRYKKDGVNTIKYQVVKKTLYTGFTHFLFDIGTLDSKSK